jgi:hypothetical protein
MRDAAALIKPAAEDVLQMWPVSKRVNSSRADGDDATLIEQEVLASSPMLDDRIRGYSGHRD